MRILIIGAAGMIGRKLAAMLQAEGCSGQQIESLILYDIGPETAYPTAAANPRSGCQISVMSGSLADPGEAERLAALRPDVIYHLAAVVSGQAEAEYDLGMAINLDATRGLANALRAEHEASGGAYRAKLVFTSSIAVFSGPYPEVIGEDFHLNPQNSYGTGKAMAELLLADLGRRGWLDTLSLRLPTIVVRPGKPNKAASSFFSGIIREPLNGKEAVLPITADFRHWFASPRSAAGFLCHAGNIDFSHLGHQRSLNMPGLCCTVGDLIDALKSVAGADVAGLIRHQHDETIWQIVSGWPHALDASRASGLGFKAETDPQQLIRAYLEDDFDS